MIRRLLSGTWALAAGQRQLFRVRGMSMTPTLQDGDIVCADTTTIWPEVGDVVVVRDPTHPRRVLVKRVRSKGDASFAVGSDAPAEGRDSRHFGSLGREHFIGRVVWTWSPRRESSGTGTGWCGRCGVSVMPSRRAE